MAIKIIGTAWVFGDDINTDVMAPGVHMKMPIEEAVQYCLESVDPGFASGVRAGDIIVAGANFGLGSSREQAPEALKVLGVGAILAKSFARTFYRNAVNLGLPTLFFPRADEIVAGDRLEIDLANGAIHNLRANRAYSVEPIPPHLLRMIRDGGLMKHLKVRLDAERRA